MSRDHVQLIDCRIRIRAEGHDAITAAVGESSARTFDDAEEALGATDDYIVVETNEAGDITGLERDSYDDSLAGRDVWDAIAPWVDADDYLAYRETWDESAYRVRFDGRGGYTTERGRMVYGAA